MAKNDPPTNQRFGFGYDEAKAAGVPWDAIKARSIAEVVAHGKENKERREKPIRTMESLRARLPNLEDLARAEIAAGKTAEQIAEMLETRAKEQDRLRAALAKHTKR